MKKTQYYAIMGVLCMILLQVTPKGTLMYGGAIFFSLTTIICYFFALLFKE